jgi:hypothetical protein
MKSRREFALLHSGSESRARGLRQSPEALEWVCYSHVLVLPNPVMQRTGEKWTYEVVSNSKKKNLPSLSATKALIGIRQHAVGR